MRKPNLYEREDLPHPALALNYQSAPLPDSETERIEHALKLIADIVADDGEEYLSIFERLENELAERQVRDAALKRALSMSSSKS